MKKTHHFLAILLASVLLLPVCGCRAVPAAGSGGTLSGSSADTSTLPAPQDNSLDPVSEQDPLSLEPNTVRLLLPWSDSQGISTQEGRDRVASVLAAWAKGLDLSLSVTWVEVQELPVRLASACETGEVFDLCYIPGGFFALREKGLLLSVPEKTLKKYAPTYTKQMQNTLPASSDGNIITGFPAWTVRGAVKVMGFRADICQAVGYSREDVYGFSSWNEIEGLMREAQAFLGEDFVGMAPIEAQGTVGLGLVGYDTMCSNDRFDQADSYDGLGDPLQLVGVSKYHFSAESEQRDIDCIWNGSVGERMEPLRRMWFWNQYYGWVKTDVKDDKLKAYQGDSSDIFARLCVLDGLADTGFPYGWTDPDRYWVEVAAATPTTRDFDGDVFAIPVTAQAPLGALCMLELLFHQEAAGDLAELLYSGSEAVSETGAAADDYRNEAFSRCLFLPEGTEEFSGFRQSLSDRAAAQSYGRYLGFSPETGADPALAERLRVTAMEIIPPVTWGLAEYSQQQCYQPLISAGLQDYIDYYLTQLNAWLADQ